MISTLEDLTGLLVERDYYWTTENQWRWYFTKEEKFVLMIIHTDRTEIKVYHDNLVVASYELYPRTFLVGIEALVKLL